MKFLDEFRNKLTEKTFGQWCQAAAIRAGILFLYALGIYLVAMAWIHEPWAEVLPIKVAATLAGIAVFAGAWYLGKRSAPAPPEATTRAAPRPKPRSKKR